MECVDVDEFDLTLEPPFPSISAVRWRLKLRDGEGKPLVDENGDVRMGKETLTSLDNRRLYVLQRAAVRHYPKRCRVAAWLLDRAEVMRDASSLKKLRTRTIGLSITISEWTGVGRDNSRAFSAMRVWDWRAAVEACEAADLEASEVAADLEEASSSGSTGGWQYLDPSGVHRGPFSNFQMRQWWDRGMFPAALRIRPYDPLVAMREKGGEEGAEFLPVADVFENSVTPFAAGAGPKSLGSEHLDTQRQKCSECGRNRWEGRTAHGKWYCATCWRRWERRSG